MNAVIYGAMIVGDKWNISFAACCFSTSMPHQNPQKVFSVLTKAYNKTNRGEQNDSTIGLYSESNAVF